MEFSVKSALRFGWETFMKRPWFFVLATLIVAIAHILVNALTGASDNLLTGSAEHPSIVGVLLSIGLGTLINMGAVAFYLSAHDNPDTVELSALWHPHPFWKYLGASILAWLAFALGLVLLIVPGIIFGLMFMFATILVIDRDLGPIEAMRESNRVTRGHKWNLLGLVLVLALVNVLGALALFVGLLVSVPVTLLALMQVYRILAGGAGPADASLAA